MADTKVKVAVRVRPMNRRELDLNTKCIVEMEGNQTVLHPPPSNTKQGENRVPVCDLNRLSNFILDRTVIHDGTCI
ncbi:kinesin-like protein KIF13A [Alligator mississippiensis]|uniref:Kinesin-like protein KIF13A n=1 Tax=Alligator mississippiensis TaxID=8496 RepID=A0A151MNV5_ALLMI|nr:kinesin-like protein KIF13A [Alligator mississippiensis]